MVFGYRLGWQFWWLLDSAFCCGVGIIWFWVVLFGGALWVDVADLSVVWGFWGCLSVFCLGGGVVAGSGSGGFVIWRGLFSFVGCIL